MTSPPSNTTQNVLLTLERDFIKTGEVALQDLNFKGVSAQETMTGYDTKQHQWYTMMKFQTRVMSLQNVTAGLQNDVMSLHNSTM